MYINTMVSEYVPKKQENICQILFTPKLCINIQDYKYTA